MDEQESFVQGSAAMSNRWIKLYRKFMYSPIMQHDGMTRLWLHCLLVANWKDAKWLIPGTTTEINIPRGSFVTGRESLHATLYPKTNNAGQKIKRDKTPTSRTLWNWLQSLEKMKCVKLQVVSNRCTVVSVCNYSSYQKKQKPKFPAAFPQASSTLPAAFPLPSTLIEGLEVLEGVDSNRNNGLIGEQEIQKPKQPEPAQPLVPAHAILDDAFRSIHKPVALVPLPDVLNTPAFQDTWAKWLNYYTVEKGMRYAQTTMQAHLADLARDGPTTAAERVSEAMANGWLSPARRKQDKPATTKQQQPDWLTKARAKNANKTA